MDTRRWAPARAHVGRRTSEALENMRLGVTDRNARTACSAFGPHLRCVHRLAVSEPAPAGSHPAALPLSYGHSQAHVFRAPRTPFGCAQTRASRRMGCLAARGLAKDRAHPGPPHPVLWSRSEWTHPEGVQEKRPGSFRTPGLCVQSWKPGARRPPLPEGSQGDAARTGHGRPARMDSQPRGEGAWPCRRPRRSACPRRTRTHLATAGQVLLR